MLDTVSIQALIREMDASELIDKARELYNAASPQTFSNYCAYEYCKKQYRQITGEEMPVLLFLIESA